VKVIGIIPARFASTRFPGKPLVDIAGKTMIQRVLEQVCASKRLHYVLVATDDERIHQHVLDLGYHSVMTSLAHQSGTDRCAEALALKPMR
jgi:3-deoxy-manno-octulosonate cytidylyltransferase (CMP-KDO synthetase)